MKQWMLFFSFLLSVKLLVACGGWYPFGESVRFSLLHPQAFDDGGMAPFYYSADYISGYYYHAWNNDRNVDDWYAFTGQKVSKEDVFQAVYQLTATEICDPKSTHPFVVQMRAQGSTAELEYLAFAKRYSYLNSTWEDPWEKGGKDLKGKRKRALKKALKLAQLAPSESLKRRYAFQAIRFAFYNDDFTSVEKVYTDYFEHRNELIIDKWAQYYYLQFAPASPEINFKLAQLFTEIPSKRFGIFSLFDWEAKQADVLAFARTPEERANVLALYAARLQDRALPVIGEISKLDPDHVLLPFLITREMNKIEDWIQGPLYTAFAPVMRPGLDAYTEDQNLIQEAVRDDRAYAGEFLRWMNAHRTSIDQELFRSVTASLQFCVGEPKQAYQSLDGEKFTQPEREAWRQRMMALLQLAAGGEFKSLNLSLFLEGEYTYKDRFIFMLGRVCEYRKELGNALLLYAQINKERDPWSGFTWAEPRGYTRYNITFYFDYFDYFDANYSAAELEEALMQAWDLRKNTTDDAGLALTDFVERDEQRLKDLLGTKYFREDQLEASLRWLKQVPDSYWKSEDNHYRFYLAANPFYANLYSEHRQTEGDTVSYTKYEIAQKLQDMIQLAEKQKGNKKARTLYHIANCYFNMTTYGNSWMMRRSWWSASVINTIYVDNAEFTQCLKARDYFMQAYAESESGQFKALCLRMAGRCESYQIMASEEYDYSINYEKYGGYQAYIFQKNATYKRLKKEFPEYEEELISNCYSFNRFYRSI